MITLFDKSSWDTTLYNISIGRRLIANLRGLPPADSRTVNRRPAMGGAQWSYRRSELVPPSTPPTTTSSPNHRFVPTGYHIVPSNLPIARRRANIAVVSIRPALIVPADATYSAAIATFQDDDYTLLHVCVVVAPSLVSRQRHSAVCQRVDGTCPTASDWSLDVRHTLGENGKKKIKNKTIQSSL